MWNYERLLYLGAISWVQARDTCHQKGGYLVEVDTKVKVYSLSYHNPRGYFSEAITFSCLKQGRAQHPVRGNSRTGLGLQGEQNWPCWRPHWPHQERRKLAVGQLWKKAVQWHIKMEHPRAKWGRKMCRYLDSPRWLLERLFVHKDLPKWKYCWKLQKTFWSNLREIE